MARTPATTDFDIYTAGSHVRIVPLSERAVEWFWSQSRPESWPYFHWRRYGETPFGWFLGTWDDGFEALLAELRRADFRVADDPER